MMNLRQRLTRPIGWASFRWLPNSGMKPFFSALLALGWFTAAWGDATRSDPTLPPPAWLAMQPKAPGAAALVNQDESSGVQLILIGKSRKLAMVDGQVIRPGDTYNGSKVLAIKPGELVLQNASSSLRLTPDVEKRVINPAQLQETRSAVLKHKRLGIFPDCAGKKRFASGEQP